MKKIAKLALYVAVNVMTIGIVVGVLGGAVLGK